MPSFRTSLTPNKRIAARFVVGVRRTILKAFADEQKRAGLTQTAIANKLGVHRSVINREMRGAANMTLGRAAEIGWAMGYQPHFELRRSSPIAGQNVRILPPEEPAPAGSAGDYNRLLTPVAA